MQSPQRYIQLQWVNNDDDVDGVDDGVDGVDDDVEPNVKQLTVFCCCHLRYLPPFKHVKNEECIGYRSLISIDQFDIMPHVRERFSFLDPILAIGTVFPISFLLIPIIAGSGIVNRSLWSCIIYFYGLKSSIVCTRQNISSDRSLLRFMEIAETHCQKSENLSTKTTSTSGEYDIKIYKGNNRCKNCEA
ncbi:hypothetical protein Btru_044778 [Bulinus truncatus]|nr:hypothetical protein Btru_044778 [Bulinus truncatus]